MRYLLVALSFALCSLVPAPARAQVSVEIGLPGVSIGFNSFPRLVRVPGYPVYYAPQASANYFFYDGLYWVYAEDNWYSSSWYNGPWELVGPEYVPYFLLRVPVRYYRRPPSYFRGWRANAAPRWGDHWGRDWEQRRSGWNTWDRRSTPAPAPLPTYQRQYSGERYPREVQQQRTIQSQNYRYQPREDVTRQRLAPPQEQRQAAPPPQERRQAAPRPQERRQTAPPPQERHQMAPPPQDRHDVAPQNRGQEKKVEARDKGHENKPPKQNKGQEKKDERGQDRH